MTTRSIKIFILLILLQEFTWQSFLFSQLPPKDRVIDTVKCWEQMGQSYALYLPPQYNSNEVWPLIMIFDASARGKSSVEIFSEAGRKYGYILACSNNSRNGPLGNNFTAASAMLQDLEKRFTLDQKRIYAAGFSGGSRFAIALAATQSIIAGVIGCGAGLPNDNSLFPSQKSEFVYYGVAGTRDMNYLEMNDLVSFFPNQTRVIPFIRSFNGGHQWPDQSIITEAVEWITLQAMNRKIIPYDKNFIATVRKKSEDLINSELAAGNQTVAAMYMRFAVRDFQGTQFASDMAKKLSDSERSASYRQAIKEWNGIATDEQGKKEKYFSYLNEIVYSGMFPDSASRWWKNETEALVKLRDNGTTGNSQMASRILNFISILCSDQATALYRNKSYLQASILFEVCTISDSENPLNYYNLARALAGLDKTKESVDALSAAINHGFNSRKTVEADPVFVRVRENGRYKTISVKLK
ncbi:MAG: hypothetical protein ABR974_03070 [Bacteroidales bacterium]|jgi:hypothetical protein